jgi:hypothetical protein
MQRKQQLGECWVCVIFFAWLAIVSPFLPQDMCRLSCLVLCVASICVSIVGRFFGTLFFVDGFIILVKELGLLTNPGHWVRVFDVVGSYMYIVL